MLVIVIVVSNAGCLQLTLYMKQMQSIRGDKFFSVVMATVYKLA